MLVPFPHAVDDHQTFNAQYLVEAGAARCYADSALTPDAAGERRCAELCASGRAGLLRLAEAARGASREAAPRRARTCSPRCLRAEAA